MLYWNCKQLNVLLKIKPFILINLAWLLLFCCSTIILATGGGGGCLLFWLYRMCRCSRSLSFGQGIDFACLVWYNVGICSGYSRAGRQNSTKFCSGTG